MADPIAAEILEIFDNPAPQRDYEIVHSAHEFTSLCPVTGQPDFGSLTFTYVADQKCVELKSLKLYLWSYRDEGAFHEKVTNQILDDLVAAAEFLGREYEAPQLRIGHSLGGSAVLAAALDVARGNGAVQVFLEVAADNTPALALYR